MNRTRIQALLAAALMLSAAVAAHAGWPEGVAAFRAGDLNKAATEFRAVVEAQPDWPGGHFMLGWTLLKQGQNRDAVTHLRKSYDLNPNDVNTQLRLGEAYVRIGRYSDAVAFLSKINASGLPADAQGLHAQLLAKAYSETGQSDRALAEFAKAARANADDASVQYQYGIAAFNDGDTQTAVSALGKAAQLEPRNQDMQKAYATALSRLGRETRGDAKKSAYDRASRAAQALVALNASYDNLMLLGEAQLGAKSYDSAVETFEKAAAKNAGEWLTHYYIGQAYTAKQQYKSAEAALKTSLDKTGSASNQAKIWKQLGFVYEKQKNYNEALRAYERGGDQGGAARVKENMEVNQYNQSVEAEAEEIRRLKEEQERIKKELQDLPGGPPPR